MLYVFIITIETLTFIILPVILTDETKYRSTFILGNYMKLSPDNIKRLRQLITDGSQVLQECEDLKCGLNETIKAIGEEMEVKPAIISKLIKDIHKNKINDKREDHEVWEELYKAAGL